MLPKNEKNYNLILVQTGIPSSENCFLIDQLFIRLLNYLEHENNYKEIIEISYKPRNSNKINEDFNKYKFLNIVKDKAEIINSKKKNLVLCGQTTLAYELREAGAFVVGISNKLSGPNDFPSIIFNDVTSIKEKSSTGEIDNFFKFLFIKSEEYYKLNNKTKSVKKMSLDQQHRRINIIIDQIKNTTK